MDVNFPDSKLGGLENSCRHTLQIDFKIVIEFEFLRVLVGASNHGIKIVNQITTIEREHLGDKDV